MITEKELEEMSTWCEYIVFAHAETATEYDACYIPDTPLTAVLRVEGESSNEKHVIRFARHTKKDMLALIAEVRRLKELTACDCGRELSTGLCSVCDNDE